MFCLLNELLNIVVCYTEMNGVWALKFVEVVEVCSTLTVGFYCCCPAGRRFADLLWHQSFLPIYHDGVGVEHVQGQRGKYRGE